MDSPHRIDPIFFPLMERAGCSSPEELAKQCGLSLAVVLWMLHPDNPHDELREAKDLADEMGVTLDELVG